MAKIAIPKTEYLKLRRQASAYQKLVQTLFKSVVRDPIEEIMEDFRKTDLYTGNFLKDMEAGLRKSSLGKQ